MSLEFPRDQVAIIADGDTGQTEAATAIFEKWNAKNGQLASFQFGNKRDFVLIQCADLFVGEERKAWLASQSWMRSDSGELRWMLGGKQGRGTYWSLETERMISAALRAMKARSA